jgi:hypothetical protein
MKPYPIVMIFLLLERGECNNSNESIRPESIAALDQPSQSCLKLAISFNINGKKVGCGVILARALFIVLVLFKSEGSLPECRDPPGSR